MNSRSISATGPPPPAAAPAQACLEGTGERRAFLASAGLLVLVYLGWLLVFWPGVLGEDSSAILQEVDRPEHFRSGKSAFWYYFVRWTYGVTHRVEVPVAILLLLCALFFARMLAWYWARGHRLLCVMLLVFVCAAPHMVYFMATLYPDAIFAVASCALLFELWWICSQKRHSRASLALIALALPFAVFVRANGALFLAPAVVAIFLVHRKSRLPLCAIIGLWCALAYTGTKMHKPAPQSAMDSLVLFETVKLLQPRAMNDLWQKQPLMNDPWVLQAPKLSARTLEILEGHAPRQLMLAYSDPAYWDMLVFHPQGPQLFGLTEDRRKELAHEFLRYNLWHNLPDVAASRVNVLLSAALAQGGFPALDYARHVIRRTQAQSQMRIFRLDSSETALRGLLRQSHAWRWLLWTPWLGFTLLAMVLWHGVRQKNVPALLISVPPAIHLTAIAVFATAGEYRYLLPFFVLTPALLAVLISRPGISKENAATTVSPKSLEDSSRNTLQAHAL